ncbi:peptidoglycan-associated lipoprotein [Methylobacillus rhizosphaerae]|uniref:Peptidoglycan-associated lipoprotein n=1 Tax=Methylobacillus rhizosphaerae TaxID=551994 RepID=A0A238XVG1_9PROT|nr:peptidoglycan-associated lipoprotein Pal [Methylobacillus rhizosphaerae]SNR62722.1 peptidoglycan-associated lipoprotein [Methylobacillus rhizosphaerae]
MNKNIVMSVLLVAMLAACSSKAVKETPQAAVEDKSPAVSQTTGGNETATSGVSDSSLSSNPLTDPNNILSKRSVYFDYDSDAIKAEFRPLVEAHAQYLNSHNNAKVFLQGNTDDRGTREYNLSLGQRRAVAVKKALNLLGVKDAQIETVSFGKEKANGACSSDSCWQQDRRVELQYQGE